MNYICVESAYYTILKLNYNKNSLERNKGPMIKVEVKYLYVTT